MWVVVVVLLLLFSYVIGFSIVLYAALVGAVFGVFRVFQVLIYTDLRIRHENLGVDLDHDWNELVGRLKSTAPQRTTPSPEVPTPPFSPPDVVDDAEEHARTPQFVPRHIDDTPRQTLGPLRRRSLSRVGSGGSETSDDDAGQVAELTPREKLVIGLAVIGSVVVLAVAGSLIALTQASGGQAFVGQSSVDAERYLAVSEGRSGYFFISPDGQWRCAILPTRQPASAGCQPAENDTPGLAIAGAPVAVPDLFGNVGPPNAIVLERGAPAQIVWLGQAEFWRFPTEATPVLPSASSVSAEGFACGADVERGVSCVDVTTGRGFRFSASGFVAF